MTDLLRILLLLGIAGSAVTLVGSAAVWWRDEERRLTRIIRRVLGDDPDAVIIAHGRNAAAAVSLSQGKALVLRDGGARALLYPLLALQGAELVIDDQVAARAWRGEARRPLDRIDNDADRVTLRLVFDNARDPDFELELWPPLSAVRRDAASVADAIQEARTWMARAEVILRQPSARASVQTPPPPPPDDDPPWDEDEPD